MTKPVRLRLSISYAGWRKAGLSRTAAAVAAFKISTLRRKP